MSRKRKNEKGTVLVIVVLMTAAMLGVLAMITDVGLSYIKQQKLENAVDAAALAGAQKVRDSKDEALALAQDYAGRNGVDSSNLNVSFPSDGKSVAVYAKDSVDFGFAKALGIYRADLKAASKATAAPVTGIRGARPLAVEKFPFEYGVNYVLKEGAGGSYSGNFGAVSLGGTGASVFRDNMKYSYKGLLSKNDWIKTETGDMTGPGKEGLDYLMGLCTHTPKCTIDSYVPTCSRVITIPIVNTLQVNGSGEIQVIGFAQFLLSGAENKNGHMQITGWFIKNLEVGETDPNLNAEDFGTYSVKLIK